MNLVKIVWILGAVGAAPLKVAKRAAENAQLERLENYLPKIGDWPKFHYSTFGEDKSSNEVLLPDEIEFKSLEKGKTLSDVVDFVKEGAAAGLDLFNEVKDMVLSTLSPEATTLETESTTLDQTTEYSTTTSGQETTTESTITGVVPEKYQLDPVLDSGSNDTANRPIRQEEETSSTESSQSEEGDEGRASGGASQETPGSGEEEEENMITGLISAFLGGLSRPDGSVDVEAITGLLGSLSSQNPDGTYNFSGLTELLMSFFGGGGEEGGGSDFGAFLGGIAGAFIQGVANPPGAKGTGAFLGNLLSGILPSLSAPAPPAEGQQPQPGPDSGGFFSGLLSSVLGSSGGLSGGAGSSNSSGGDPSTGGGSKFSLFKAIFSIITSIFTSSSAIS